ncbi:MlaD family protein [Paraconexibacter antarcticus]|uniref:MlaD family protein n=1 Tax=Paraconexibacter antarcticus TaxID=2949664 RepID=A0ABY5DQR6_9ACTN|nr:MlaD family protein [Paraconexibacter antarcticus]UTI63256.1 MlaD family protein [Paraconexibacter antarcticus]
MSVTRGPRSGTFAAGRVIALGALVLVAVVIAVVLLRGGGAYHVRLEFVNASQLVKGDQVKVGGLPVGTVSGIDLGADGQAIVTANITAGDLTPLHVGTTGVVRINSLSSVANRFVALNPGPNSSPKLGEGALIPTEKTTSQVELDSVLNTLDVATRSATQRLLRGTAGIYTGQEAAANKGLEALDPALSQLDATAREISRDQPALERFLVKSAVVVGAVSDRDPELRTALDATATTAQTLADRRAELEGVLAKAPATLGQASTTLRDLGTTFTSLQPAARELTPVAAPAAKLVAELQPLLRQGPSALRSVSVLLPSVQRVLRAMPTLRSAALPAFKAAIAGINGALPIVDEALPYVPDLYGGLVSGFGGGAVQAYDANGHYARIEPIANTQVLTGALGALGKAIPTSHEDGLTNRCPGAAYEQLSDSSSPIHLPTGLCDAGQDPGR